jgi:predicted phosphodiesterase
MTRLAVLSDLHGNAAATEAVLADIDAEAPDEILCLGDLVGYGSPFLTNHRPDP